MAGYQSRAELERQVAYYQNLASAEHSRCQILQTKLDAAQQQLSYEPPILLHAGHGPERSITDIRINEVPIHHGLCTCSCHRRGKLRDCCEYTHCVRCHESHCST